jgi:hypothetical protein
LGFEVRAVLVVSVLNELGSFHREAVEWRKTTPRRETSEALSQFWRRPELAGIAQGLDLPHAEWQDVESCLLGLSSGDVRVGSRRDWTGVATATTDLSEHDPLAASIAALYALAAWEGELGENLLRYPPDDGWYVFPLHVSRALYAADAMWACMLVAERAKGFIEIGSSPLRLRGVPREAVRASTRPYEEIVARSARRINRYETDLAWDLKVACAPGEHTFRAEVAALFWTLGDVPCAELLASAEGRYEPVLSTLIDLVDTSIRRLPSDPLLQFIWLEMKDRPPVDLRGHTRLFDRINAKYPLSIEDEAFVFAPSRAYAQALIAYMAGHVSDEQKQAFNDQGARVDMLIDAGLRLPYDLLWRLRLRALRALLSEVDEQTRRLEWEQIAEIASKILGLATERGEFVQYHTVLALPFFYLEGAGDEEAIHALDILERHRCADLAYWLSITPPRPPSVEPDLPLLLEQEARLLGELRSARFIRMIPYLPMHYQNYEYDLRELEPPPNIELREPRGSHLLYDPLDDEVAAAELQKTWEQLVALWTEMEEIAPVYARARRDPNTNLEAFIGALRRDRIPREQPIVPLR